MKKNKAAKMNATMEWKGRKLLCNGVYLACIGGSSIRPGLWFADAVHEIISFHRSERTARRAINRRFKLPLDFGESK
jgi:hypothetical protein